MNILPTWTFCLVVSISCIGQPTSADPLKPPISYLPTAELSSVKMNSDTVAKMLKLIRTTPPNDFRGLVVIKDNKLVLNASTHQEMANNQVFTWHNKYKIPGLISSAYGQGHGHFRSHTVFEYVLKSLIAK